MPSLGGAYYPTIGITEAVEATVAIETDFRGSITTGGLASHLGMAETGGAFRHKLTALHRYDLVSGRGTLNVTPLGQRVAHPATTAERDTAIGQAFLNVDLFRRLHDRFQDAAPTENQFGIVLEELTGASRRDVASRSTRVRRLYLDGLRYLTSAPAPPRLEEDEEPTSDQRDEVSERAMPAKEASVGIVLNDGKQRFVAERSLRGVGLLRKYLDLLEEQLRMEAAGEEAGDDVE